MKSKLLTGDELTGLRQLNDDVESSKKKAGYLINDLVNVFGRGHSIGGIPPMSIEKSEGPQVLGSVTSQFGTGRFVMAYRTEGKIVKAQLVVERATQSQDGKETWEPVMTIQLPKPDWIMDGETVGDSDKAFVLGASILHSLINGLQPV